MGCSDLSGLKSSLKEKLVGVEGTMDQLHVLMKARKSKANLGKASQKLPKQARRSNSSRQSDEDQARKTTLKCYM